MIELYIGGRGKLVSILTGNERKAVPRGEPIIIGRGTEKPTRDIVEKVAIQHRISANSYVIGKEFESEKDGRIFYPVQFYRV